MKQHTIDSRCSLWDIGVTTTFIEQKEFEILAPPKRGGSCLVYEAYKKEKNGLEEYKHRVILKEFYPMLNLNDAVGIRREKDGSLFVSEEIRHSSYYRKRWEKFRASYKMMLELGEQSDSNDHSVTVLSLSEANGTLYIEEAYDSGRLIFDYEETPTLNEFLTTMKNCLLVLKNLHQLGYYHLDLKPDNISCTKSGVIKFWDIDSFVKISELDKYPDFLWSDGFSAPEIESAAKRPYDAPYLIGPWTDIYSVAQLFCYYCFKKPLQYMELLQVLPELAKHIPQADFYITKDHYMGEYLHNNEPFPLFSKNAIYLLKHFLLRSLSFRQTERYQTIDEALTDLNIIIEQCDCNKIQPVDTFTELNSENFFNFDQFDDLKKLENFFCSQKCKDKFFFATITEGNEENRLHLADYYATKHRLDYDTIIKVQSDKLDTALHMFYFYGQKPAAFNSQHILADLKQYCRNHKLLIIINDILPVDSLLSGDDKDRKILNELMQFQDIPPHFLFLSEYNRLGNYILTENGQKQIHPFFELKQKNDNICADLSNTKDVKVSMFHQKTLSFLSDCLNTITLKDLFLFIFYFYFLVLSSLPDDYLSIFLGIEHPGIYLGIVRPFIFIAVTMCFYGYLNEDFSLDGIIHFSKENRLILLTQLCISIVISLPKIAFSRSISAMDSFLKTYVALPYSSYYLKLSNFRSNFYLIFLVLHYLYSIGIFSLLFTSYKKYTGARNTINLISIVSIFLALIYAIIF